MHGYHEDDETADSSFNPSDQQLRLPQPPLCKAPMADESARISLPLDFSGLELNNDIISIIRDRRSSRVYAEEEMSIEELQAAIIARMEKNGPVTERMRQDVIENVYHNSLVTWIKSFN